MISWTQYGITLVVGLLVGAVLGVALYIWQLKRTNANRPLPAHWPLAPHLIVSTLEEKLWEWLREIFPEHQVMVKTPILRFTGLSDAAKNNSKAKADYERWQDHLGGVYTTFIVCTTDGEVIGCVDVSGKIPLTKTSRELKEALFSDCGIAYMVVMPSNPPNPSAIRAAFLGEVPSSESMEDVEEIVHAGDTRFHAELKAFARQPGRETKDTTPTKSNKRF